MTDGSLEELRRAVDDNRRNAQKLYLLQEQVRLQADPNLGALMLRAYELRTAAEADWTKRLKALSERLYAALDVEGAATYALMAWTPEQPVQRRRWGVLRKEQNTPPVPPSEAEVRAKLVGSLSPATWESGGVSAYVALALETSTQAGQLSLELLGLNRTFAWAHPQAMAQDTFAVRGSKVIQQMYSNHVEALTRIIVEATDPRDPKALSEVKREIRTRWGKLQPYQVDRIARTESASVWTTTQANAYEANGITKFETIVAHGPSIGIESEDPCDICVTAAASGPFDITGDLPPWHPNCRCEAIPVLEDEDGEPWLPPQEPWTGGEAELTPTPDPEGPTPDVGEAGTPAQKSAFEERLEQMQRRARR